MSRASYLLVTLPNEQHFQLPVLNIGDSLVSWQPQIQRSYQSMRAKRERQNFRSPLKPICMIPALRSGPSQFFSHPFTGLLPPTRFLGRSAPTPMFQAANWKSGPIFIQRIGISVFINYYGPIWHFCKQVITTIIQLHRWKLIKNYLFLTSDKIDFVEHLRSITLWPLSEIRAANLVRSPLRIRSMSTAPRSTLATTPSFSHTPRTYPLLLIQFSSRSAPFSAPIPLHLHTLVRNSTLYVHNICTLIAYTVADCIWLMFILWW